MDIDRGARLGPYEVISALGAGGMGEVWRGRDTRLDREVAIKVLPVSLASSPQFRARFDREAKAISSLNHPHICTLHDVGHHSGVDYLVMELIEGESLADRLRKGPLPLDQVLRYGAQIAQALDAAHRHGIVHRDLKPGNVMLTRSGAKLLDFGLAKGSEGLSSGASLVAGATSVRPAFEGATEARPLTQEGTIVGTFQYMAPEQLEGNDADARTDIFALGCLLYEMATGRRAFLGSTKTSLIAAIVSSQPAPISSVAPMTPPALDHVVRRCLEKDADDRWQSAHDVASELQWISEAGSAAGVAAPVARRKRRIEWAGWAAALAVAITWGAIALTRRPAVPLRVETAIVAPDGVIVDAENGGVVLSPDGRRVAFVGHRAGEKRLVWIRDVGSSTARPLAGSNEASLPFWSPDGMSIAFFTPTQLLRISADGGSPDVVTGVTEAYGGTWAPDGSILFASENAVSRIPASGGAVTKLVDVPNRFPRFPGMLPDGRRFLFTMIGGAAPAGLYVASLDGEAPRRVLEGVYSNAVFAPPGWILYVREGALRAQRVDVETLAPSGEPVRLAERVQYIPDDQFAFFSVTDHALVFIAGGEAGRTELAWVSRDGRELEVIGTPAMYYSPRLSNDGKRLAVDISELQTASGDIWILDLQRGASSRLSHDPANESSPLWTRDDRSVIFYSEKKGQNLYQRSASGIGTEDVVLEDDKVKRALDVSPDGRWLAYGVDLKDVWLLDRQSGKPKPYLTSPFLENAVQFSPDGKRVAYTSDESGQHEVYVVDFPESSAKWIVSRGGGVQPGWSADGRELYYVSKEQKLMAVPVASGSPFDAGTPVELFDASVREGYLFRQYCVSPDGARFLLNRRIEEKAGRPMTLVQNWAGALAP